MKRSFLVWALLLGTGAAWGAQQAKSPNPYEGTSNPPPDDTITEPMPQPAAKPSPARRMDALPAAQPAAAGQVRPALADPAADYAAQGTDDGIVQVAPETPDAQPALTQRMDANDPDGDIVHPAPLPPGELGDGTMIRARLLERLSTAYSQNGDSFRATVDSDVLRGSEVLIPAGSEIDGTVVHVSTGHFGGHGSMLLRPQTVILPSGSTFSLYAQVTGAPEANARVGDEGAITPGSRLKKDGIEYGGGVGVGVVAGAALGGPAGALAGSLVGAGAVTVHLLMDHPQATLETGTVLLFTLTQPLNLVPVTAAGSE